MDPLTAFLNALTAVNELFKTVVDSQPPDVRAELWRMYLEDVKAFRAFFTQFHKP